MPCSFISKSIPKIGKELTECGLNFYRKMKQTCRPEIEAYARCIDETDGRYPLTVCLENRGYFDDCMKNKFGLEKPELGYFSQIRVHNSSRPEPEHTFERFPMQPGLPGDYEQSIIKGKKPANVTPLYLD